MKTVGLCDQFAAEVSSELTAGHAFYRSQMGMLIDPDARCSVREPQFV